MNNYMFNKKKMDYDGKWTQNLSFSGNIRPTKNWSFNWTASYDFNAHKLAYMNCSISRDLHCFTMSASFVPVGPYQSYNFHIAVKEVGRNVIFLRKLMEGGVAHSFGLHVARMAGMPKQVLESAERTLAALESSEKVVLPGVSAGQTEKSSVKKKNTIKPYNVREGRVESDGSLQLSFFQLEDPLLSSLKDELDKADLNNMTPLQAFDLLRSMKDQLGI